MTELETLLEQIEWLSDDGPGSYTEEAYRKMPGEIKKLLAALRMSLSALDYYEDKDGGPYAPGDWHTADGGQRAFEAKQRVLAALSGEEK